MTHPVDLNVLYQKLNLEKKYAKQINIFYYAKIIFDKLKVKKY